MIIIVEDDSDIRESLKELLESRKYEVIDFSNVLQFNDACNEGKIKAELFLLDVKLPDGDGFEICKNIRKTDNKEWSGTKYFTK